MDLDPDNIYPLYYQEDWDWGLYIWLQWFLTDPAKLWVLMDMVYIPIFVLLGQWHVGMLFVASVMI